MTIWRVIKSLPASGFQNMKLDEQLFFDCENGAELSTLRIYAWNPPCISLGYSQDIEKNIDIYKTFDLGWEIIKRPTGGGIVFHNQSETTFSAVTAINGAGLIEAYLQTAEAAVRAFEKIGIKAQIRKTKVVPVRKDICFSYPAEYEIVAGERKLAGLAQKRGKRAMLNQCSIFVRNDYQQILEVLKNPVDRDFFSKHAISAEEILKREIPFDEMADALIAGFNDKLGIQL